MRVAYSSFETLSDRSDAGSLASAGGAVGHAVRGTGATSLVSPTEDELSVVVSLASVDEALAELVAAGSVSEVTCVEVLVDAGPAEVELGAVLIEVSLGDEADDDPVTVFAPEFVVADEALVTPRFVEAVVDSVAEEDESELVSGWDLVPAHAESKATTETRTKSRRMGMA